MKSSISSPRTFTHLFCLREQAQKPHRAGRVIAQQGQSVTLEVWCQSCGQKAEQVLSELPAGYSIYQVRVTGEDNPAMPAHLRPLLWLETELAVVATSAQHAHEVAELAHQIRFSGHLVKYYINGELHLDERF